MNGIGWIGVGWRFIAALFLVLATYNPSGYSYFHWLKQVLPGLNPYVALAGVLLIIGWVMYIRATTRSLGILGIALILAVCACIIWLFIEWGVLSLENSGALAWVILVVIAIALTVGMCWSHIRRRLSGQVDIDDVDEH